MKTEALGLTPISDAALLANWEERCFIDPWQKNSLAAQLRNPYTLALALEAEGEILGYALLQIIEDQGELLRIALWPEVRGLGWGKKFLHKLIEKLENLEVERLYLEVRADNAPAIKVYLGAGFRYDGRRIAYYRDGCDALLLYWRKEIPDATIE